MNIKVKPTGTLMDLCTHYFVLGKRNERCGSEQDYMQGVYDINEREIIDVFSNKYDIIFNVKMSWMTFIHIYAICLLVVSAYDMKLGYLHNDGNDSNEKEMETKLEMNEKILNDAKILNIINLKAGRRLKRSFTPFPTDC
ncbi:Hypothetical predicted protein [Mytilus galloprovincialis]|uniref:Uncharacterized protein n=1 Tax=Mytilus galloprovincialis TaxID=29158 RepID=A0A8B6EKW1_MYTGA|nr:Hypothetical predicted protein [Mytilus galloprovincialis]